MKKLIKYLYLLIILNVSCLVAGPISDGGVSDAVREAAQWEVRMLKHELSREGNSFSLEYDECTPLTSEFLSTNIYWNHIKDRAQSEKNAAIATILKKLQFLRCYEILRMQIAAALEAGAQLPEDDFVWRCAIDKRDHQLAIFLLEHRVMPVDISSALSFLRFRDDQGNINWRRLSNGAGKIPTGRLVSTL